MLLDEDLELGDYAVNFRRMFGSDRMDAVMGSVEGRVRFFGLTPTIGGLGPDMQPDQPGVWASTGATRHVKCLYPALPSAKPACSRSG